MIGIIGCIFFYIDTLNLSILSTLCCDKKLMVKLLCCYNYDAQQIIKYHLNISKNKQTFIDAIGICVVGGVFDLLSIDTSNNGQLDDIDDTDDDFACGDGGNGVVNISSNVYLID